VHRTLPKGQSEGHASTELAKSLWLIEGLRFASRRKIQAVTRVSWRFRPENLRLVQTQIKSFSQSMSTRIRAEIVRRILLGNQKKEDVLQEPEEYGGIRVQVKIGKPTSGLFSTSERKRRLFTRREIDKLAMTRFTGRSSRR